MSSFLWKSGSACLGLYSFYLFKNSSSQKRVSSVLLMQGVTLQLLSLTKIKHANYLGLLVLLGNGGNATLLGVLLSILN